MVTDMPPLPVVDDRAYVYFEYVPGHPAKPTGFDKGMQFEVCGYSGDNDKLPLPKQVRRYYRTEEAAAVATGLLMLFAVGKSKQEIDGEKV